MLTWLNAYLKFSYSDLVLDFDSNTLFNKLENIASSLLAFLLDAFTIICSSLAIRLSLMKSPFNL